MASEEILLALQTIAKDEAGIDTLPTEELQESLDSVQRMSLMVAIEDHFLIMFEPEEESELNTVDDLVLKIAEKIQEMAV